MLTAQFYRPLEHDSPSTILLQLPILALTRTAGEVTASVILFKGHNDRIALTGVGKQTDILECDLDVTFRCVDTTLVGQPRAAVVVLTVKVA